jgi:hypothetical protein
MICPEVEVDASVAAITGFRTADAEAFVHRIEGSGLIEDGKVAVIALDAIAERLAHRWEDRSEFVYDHLERSLNRQLTTQGWFYRLTDRAYLVVQPDRSRYAGQAGCLNALRDTLEHFLGKAVAADIQVHEVTRVNEDSLYGERLDMVTVQNAAEAEERAAARPDERPSSWSPFIASDGRRVRVSCVLEPVVQLKTSSRIGYRVARRVLHMPSDTPLSPRELAKLSRSDIERIDFATIERGLGRLRSDPGGKEPSLILPVSYITLSGQRGRTILIALLKAAQMVVRHGVICEICDIEGVPESALANAIGMIRPYCLYVFGHLEAPPSGQRLALKGVGLQGLSMECPPGIAGDAEFIAWAKSTRAAARPVGKSAILYRLPGLRQAAIASLLGATHGSLRAGA